MVDFVVLKRLTEKSDLGWFHSIHTNRNLAGHQKGITLNKPVINPIWPNLRLRQDDYEAAKQREKAARAPGGAGVAAAANERDKARQASHLSIHVEIYGPGGKPPIIEERLMALQDKNWRLNGAFIDDPADDPGRFDLHLQEGDLALIGFDGIEGPTRAVVVLLAQSTADAVLMADLSPLVTKGSASMVRLEPDQLSALADTHGLPPDHVIRLLAGDPIVEAALEEIAQGDLGAASKVRARRPTKPMTPEQLAAGIAANALTGYLGEQMVGAWLTEQHAVGRPVHKWMWPTSAAHPYDFELLNAAGIPETVIDAKSTLGFWTADFFISSTELAYAATSPVQYRIYRLSEVGSMGAWLRISSDIRSFAKTLVSTFVTAAPAGIRATTIAISPCVSGLDWSDPIRLSPLSSATD